MPAATIHARDRLICALDVPSRKEALDIVDNLDESVGFYKVGLQLFVAEGMAIVRELGDRGKKVFLDLKMDDVEETIRLAVTEIARAPVELLTLQGNAATARAALAGRGGSQRPKMLQVTVLSSLNQNDLSEMRLVGKDGRFPDLDSYIRWRAEQSLNAGCEGLIASGTSIRMLRQSFPDRDFLLVCPGIRPAGASSDDHKRQQTPREAIEAGADYLVVGRPIRDAADRRDAARRIIDEIASANPT